MKVLHIRLPRPNFGDELNPWLWPRLFPGIFDDDDSVVLSGIGSGLKPVDFDESKLKSRRLILGTGSGYVSRTRFSLGSTFPVRWHGISQLQRSERKTERETSSWKIYWVRGPLTTQLLGLPESCYISDAALLVATLVEAKGTRDRIGVMPHCSSAVATTIKQVCHQAGFYYIDPFAGIETVFDQILRCRFLITEALHGAVVADALRVPWIPLKTHAVINDHKWQDFCASLGMSYRPVNMGAVWKPGGVIEWFLPKLRKGVASSTVQPLMKTLIGRKVAKQNYRQADSLVDCLQDVSRQPPVLSSDRRFMEALERMHEALDEFRLDHGLSR